MSRIDELVFDALVDVIGWTSWAVTGILMLTVLAACKPIAMTLDLVAQHVGQSAAWPNIYLSKRRLGKAQRCPTLTVG